MAKGNGTFVVLEIVERIREEGEEGQKKKLRDWFGKSVRAEIEKADVRGGKALLEKLKTL